MKNLKITVYLDSALWCDNNLNIDSILMKIFLARKGFVDTVEYGSKDISRLPIEDFPIEKVVINNKLWYYNCSCGLFEAKSEYKSSIKKRVDSIAGMYMTGNVNISTNFYKAYDIKFLVKNVPKVDFYCVGNKEEIESLLSDVYGLGKKIKIGYGKISNFEVIETNEDITEYLKIRPIPYTDDIPIQEGMVIKKCTYKPPYHDNSQSVMCIVPCEIDIKQYLIMDNLNQDW
jgi:CRISPR type IV-associated protein Csf3